MVSIATWPERSIPRDIKAQALALMRAEWPAAFTGARTERESLHDLASNPTCMAVLVEGRLASYCGIVWKPIEHAGERYAAYGLSAVLTAPAVRRQGYGRRLIDAATRFMQDAGADIGVFTCDPPVRAFYEASGWTVLERTPLIGGTRAHPFPSDALGKCTLMRFFSEHAQEHRATFIGAPIYLDLAEGDLW